MAIFVVIAAVFSAGTGIVVLLVNPARFVNQVFGVMSWIVCAWLVIVFGAIQSGTPVGSQQFGSPEPWLRLNSAVGAFLPWAIWTLKEAIVNRSRRRRIILARSAAWLFFGVIAAALSLSETFLIPTEVPTWFERGSGYLVYSALMLIAFAVLTIQTIKELRKQSGIGLVEMQFMALSIAIAAILAVTVNVASSIPSLRILARFSPLMLFIAQLITAWGIANYRIYNARQALLSFAAKFCIALSFAILIYLTATSYLPFDPAFILLTSFFVIPGAIWTDGKVIKWLDLDAHVATRRLRAKVVATARSKTEYSGLVSDFKQILETHFGTSQSFFLFLQSNSETSVKPRILPPAGLDSLVETTWSTPESLARRRQTKGSLELLNYLENLDCGVIATAPIGSENPSFAIALGNKTTRWPYTYPEVQMLQNIVELIDNVLTHSQLSSEAAARAQLNSIAVISRGLAHDLRNLVTPISSFLVYTEARLEKDSTEEEVHVAAKRAIQLITGYIDDTLFYSSRLKPNFRLTRIHDLVAAIAETACLITKERNIIFTKEYIDHEIISDTILIQRAILNLVLNAIDASEKGGIVHLAIANGPTGWIEIQVVDHGRGIPAEIVEKVFDPYFTTKRYGCELRGFGLGLSIAQKIVALHNGRIRLESAIGNGTSAVIDLPVANK